MPQRVACPGQPRETAPEMSNTDPPSQESVRCSPPKFQRHGDLDVSSMQPGTAVTTDAESTIHAGGIAAPLATLQKLARDLRNEGIAHANGASDQWARSCWQTAILYWASTGWPFTADSCRDLGAPDPDSPNLVGAQFAGACKAGLIKPVGFVQSRRPSRHASWMRQWVGVDQ